MKKVREKDKAVKRPRVKKPILLHEGEFVLTAWAERASGPGWSNTPVYAVIANQSASPPTYRVVCIQPNEQTFEMKTVFPYSLQSHADMVEAVNKVTRSFKERVLDAMVAVQRKRRRKAELDGNSDIEVRRRWVRKVRLVCKNGILKNGPMNIVDLAKRLKMENRRKLSLILQWSPQFKREKGLWNYTGPRPKVKEPAHQESSS
jgi:hypothetical protein